ncbi:uncharacterized protein SCHCODRAFT_02337782 [Schizophyllum commune H4-8]|uniref:uncharacterized protein n=1 Tax=Schizophyllum commune (strain H4-8 / FGSC 9210) TaxID=578458 RepID=UPI002160DD40|nr:uncharacterized protein SCHCODRAFT_02337782 [Schizophyllum commune H4-8]KAI5890166.1 hypothetical protein SCHCODRAFT_02337782 [Schizophyllum commune H4-8]
MYQASRQAVALHRAEYPMGSWRRLTSAWEIQGPLSEVYSHAIRCSYYKFQATPVRFCTAARRLTLFSPALPSGALPTLGHPGASADSRFGGLSCIPFCGLTTPAPRRRWMIFSFPFPFGDAYLHILFLNWLPRLCILRRG